MRDLGKTVVTKSVHDIMKESFLFSLEIESALNRFRKNDWGNICKEDADINFMALENNERVMGIYDSSHGVIWLITEFYPRDYYIKSFGQPRSEGDFFPVTTVLFPNEY